MDFFVKFLSNFCEINRLNNFYLDNKAMDFRPNITPIEVIKKELLEGLILETLILVLMVNGTEKHGKNLLINLLKNIDQKYYCSSYYDISINKYGVKCGTSLKFWENKGWIHSVDPYGWSQWYFRFWLGRRSVDDERQINSWKGIVTICKGKLVKMIKDANSRLDDYSI